jgi:hypothetical protein
MWNMLQCERVFDGHGLSDKLIEACIWRESGVVTGQSCVGCLTMSGIVADVFGC